MDFTHWQYFQWEYNYGGPAGSLAQQAVIYHGYQSLDALIRWPEGWGPK